MNVSATEQKLIYINRFDVIDYFLSIRFVEVLNIFHSRSPFLRLLFSSPPSKSHSHCLFHRRAHSTWKVCLSLIFLFCVRCKKRVLVMQSVSYFRSFTSFPFETRSIERTCHVNEEKPSWKFSWIMMNNKSSLMATAAREINSKVVYIVVWVISTSVSSTGCSKHRLNQQAWWI